jgi:phosphoglycolate phosphatase
MAIYYYQSYYEKNCWQEGQLYQDIDKVLKELVRQRKKIYIATNKPERFALRILKHFEIYDYFTAIFGEPMNARLMRKGDIIRFALGYMYLIEEDRKKIVMIGDRIYDIIGAFENNIETIGVTYGAGAKEELEKAQAKYIVDKAADLLNYL